MKLKSLTEFCLVAIGALHFLTAATLAVEPVPAVTLNPLTNPDDFPIAVWTQSPARAEEYRNIGINTYVGLWNGPTTEQLAELKAKRMFLICEQNEVALNDPNAGIIIAWMHGDEPDNAQELGEGKGYGPPIPPAEILAGYRNLRAKDPSRPVLLNLGQGVAWDDWVGRGSRTGHPEDYAEYAKGSDLVSFDIYPVTHRDPAIAGKLEKIGFGLDRLKSWMPPGKPRWACIECTSIGNPEVRPSPGQVRSMVWISLVHGTKGLIYFCHQFAPQFIEAGLLADKKMASAVGEINAQVRKLAPILNRPDVPGGATVKMEGGRGSIDLLVKEHEGKVYVFAVNAENKLVQACIQIKGEPAGNVEVLDESRTIGLQDGGFEDRFSPYAVHLYRIAMPKPW